MMSADDINTKAVSAVKWATVGTVLKFAIQLGAQIILARLLGPENYGLFAIGMLVLNFSNFLADFGFSWALVQHQTITDNDIRFTYTWQFISGLIATLALYMAAPWVANYFNDPRLVSVVHWLSISCFLTAITTPGSNLLRRNLDFRWLNLIQIISYITGYLLIGIPLALNGAGVWALVCAWLGQAFTMLILTYWRSPHPMKFLFWYSGARSSSSVGATVFITNLCNWFLNNLDRVFLGRYLNAQAVGIYSVGYNLANTPNALFLAALQPAFLATGARLQGDRKKLREAYLTVIAAIGILIAPLFVLLALVANELIAVLYGEKWLSSGPVLGILALSMPLYIAWGMSTPILWNTGGKHLESLLQLPIIGIAAVLFFLYSSDGIIAVAIIAAFTMLLRTLVVSTVACSRLHITLSDLLPILGRSIIILAIISISTSVGGFFSHASGLGPIVTLAIETATGTLTVMAITLGYPRLLGVRVIKLLNRFSPPIPAGLNAYLQNKCTTHCIIT